MGGTELAAFRHKVRPVRLDSIVDITDIEKKPTLVWKYRRGGREKVVISRNRECMHRRCKRYHIKDEIPIFGIFKGRIRSNKVEKSISLRNTHIEAENTSLICLLCRIFT
jgi:hypothetical protein